MIADEKQHKEGKIKLKRGNSSFSSSTDPFHSHRVTNLCLAESNIICNNEIEQITRPEIYDPFCD